MAFVAEAKVPGAVPVLKGLITPYSGDVMAPFTLADAAAALRQRNVHPGAVLSNHRKCRLRVRVCTLCSSCFLPGAMRDGRCVPCIGTVLLYKIPRSCPIV